MRKLVIPAIGIGLVAIDFRSGSVDLLVDPVGWAMVASGAWMLRARLAAVLAVGAGLLSTAGVHFAYQRVFIDPSPTRSPSTANPPSPVRRSSASTTCPTGARWSWRWQRYSAPRPSA